MLGVKSLSLIGLAMLAILAGMFPLCEATRADEGDGATATKADFETTIEATIASVAKATSGAAAIRLEASPREADMTLESRTSWEAIVAFTYRGGDCARGACGPICSEDGGGDLLRRAAAAQRRPCGGLLRLRS